MFPKVPQSALVILRVPQLHPWNTSMELHIFHVFQDFFQQKNPPKQLETPPREGGAFMESTRFRCLHVFFSGFSDGRCRKSWGENFWSNWGMIFGGKIGGCFFVGFDGNVCWNQIREVIIFWFLIGACFFFCGGKASFFVFQNLLDLHTRPAFMQCSPKI